MAISLGVYPIFRHTHIFLLGNFQLQTVKLPEGIPDSPSKARRPNAWRGVGTADIGSLDFLTQADPPVAIENGKSPKMMG